MSTTVMEPGVASGTHAPDQPFERLLFEVASRLSGATGQQVYEETARAAAALVGAEMAMVGFTRPSCDDGTIDTVAVHCRGEKMPNFSYSLPGTPCGDVVGRQFRYYRDGVRQHYADPHLHQEQIEGYAAFPLVGSDGAALGLIATMSRSAIEHPRRIETVLRLLAERVVAEIERSGARKAQCDAEASYQAIFDAAEDPIFVHDWDTHRFVDVNRKACEVFGYSREELLASSVGELSAGEAPYTETEADQLIDKAKRDGFAQFEWRRRSRDGSLHWDDVRLKRAEIGGTRRVLAFTREITGRKAAEEALRASEAMYRAIFDASVDGLALLTPESVFVDVNAAMTTMTGFSRGELVGRSAIDFLPAEHRQLGVEFMHSALTTGYARTEQKTRRKDGVELRLEPRAVPIVYAGRPHLLVVVRDITEARERQRALVRSEGRLRATVDSSLDCIVVLDDAGIILDFNPASERCFGYERDAVLGAGFVDLVVAPSLREQFRSAFAGFQTEAANARGARRLELTCCRADGSEVTMEIAIGTASGAAGTVFVAWLHDLTERIEAERARADLERQLRQAQKMEAIGHLTGGIAHDFNNILTSVIGYIGLALDHPALTGQAELRRYLERARRSGDRARELIQQMLTYTRGTRGEPQNLMVDELVEEVVNLLDAMLPSTVQLDIELARDLPALYMDPVQAAQALMNLCINARDAMSGQGELSVGAALVDRSGARCSSCNEVIDGEFVELVVRDTGSGIPPELLDRIFEPFFSTKATGKGSGMGLATTHGILHQHGGHILVDSTAGVGTRIGLLLPPAPATVACRSAPRRVLPTVSETALRGRVLLVDDNPAVVEFMKDLLSTWGLSVTAFRDSVGAEALFRSTPRDFDVALLDQTMPRLSGMELATRLLELRPGFPVVLYTGHSDVITEDGVRAAGVRALLRKPIDRAHLRSVLAAALALPPARVHAHEPATPDER